MAVNNNIGKVFHSLDKANRAASYMDYGPEKDLASEVYDHNTIITDASFENGVSQYSRKFIWGIHRWGSNTYRIGK